MLSSLYNILNNFISRYKFLVLVLIGIIILFSALNLSNIKYDNDIETMLPVNREIVRDMRFLREAGFSNKVMLSLGLTSTSHTTEELVRAADALTGSLPGPLVTSVISGISTKSLQEELRSFLSLAPQIISTGDLLRIEKQLTLQGVDDALRSGYYRLLTPAGAFLSPFIQQDPLGIKNTILLRLEKLSNAVGYSGVIENNHFISRDGRHTLLIIDTPVFLTEGFGARKLIQYLNRHIKALPEYVEAKIISGHMHAVSNEDVIKRDIVRTATIATIAFLLIFLLVFRDIRAIVFFLIPLASVVITINLMHFVFPVLSYFVIGMGAVIVGIADDYGIHTYVAVHTAKKRTAARQIIKPLLVAALTTSSVFAAFFLSRVRGYHQLALFATTSIFLCLGFVLFIFPHFLKEGGGIPVSVKDETFPSAASDKLRIIVWCVLMLVLLLFSARIRFTSDIVQFDGSSKEVFAAEESFKRTWGINEQPALLVSTAKSEEEALQVTEAIFQKACESGEGGLITPISLWPSLTTRSDNVLRWEKFWKKGRADKLKDFIAQVSPKYNFAKDAFKPFFDNLYVGLDVEQGPENLQFFKRLKERFILKGPDGYQVISFFPDEEQGLARMRTIIGKLYPRAFVVSRKSLSRSISSAIASEVSFLSVIAAALIFILTFLLLKNLRLALISLVSVASAIIAVLGTFSILNLPMNAAALIASMVVAGLCIDYGVFILYSYQHALHTGTVKAVWVSASTTLIGAFSLLFASHPVLFSIGLTLVAGLSAGFLSSQFIIPALYRIWIVRKGLAPCVR
ncbi:hypothetical protein D4R78_07960 [bacterium]|nr:MAG: hypothetical protein D4R78_07960 [bacterium]